MAEKEPSSQSDFMIEKIKERPINKTKLFRRTVITIAMAVIFGLVACFTFFALEPVLSNWMNPKEEPPQVYFPEETEEKSPEEMLSDNNTAESSPDPSQESPEDSEGLVLEEEQIQEILSEVSLDLSNYTQLYTALAEYVQSLQKTMVTLTGISSRVDWFNDVDESENRSSGVIIANNTRELLILTDFTPLEGAQRLNVTFYNGVETTAELKRRDSTTNLAVVSIPLEILPQDLMENIEVAKTGSSTVKNLVGKPVIALGSPMGTSNSVGYGVITSVSGQASEADVNYTLLQTDIAGSPAANGILLDLQSNIVGIITSRQNSNGMQNLITAYGISDLKKRMEKLSNDVPFAYAGMHITSVTLGAHEALNVPYGAYVREVIMDSPAMRAGIRQGDVIVQLADVDVKNAGEYVTIMNYRKPGETVSIKIMRQSQNEYKEMDLQITLEELR